MLIYINSQATEVPDNVNTIGKLLDHLHVSREGTGVGINNHLTVACNWDKTEIHPEDRIMMISATFGG